MANSISETTLLEYLRLPNPLLDCERCTKGTNTVNARWDPVTGLNDWAEFNYNTLMNSYGHVLQTPVAEMPTTTPPLSKLEKEISTENTFENILIRDTMVKVSAALRVAWPLCYSVQDPRDIVEIGKGDKARRGTVEEDDRFYADWAGIRESEVSSFGYVNLCPGETKLSSKWSTSKEGRKRTDFTSPFDQIQTYCGRQWGCRYGYIITPEELVVTRVSRESIGTGLAKTRNQRSAPQHAATSAAHARTFSIETVSSGFKEMSLDTGSSYQDDVNPDIEYGPLLFKSIPWDVAGANVLTVKLALWWLHMETKKDLAVQQQYPPL